MQVVQGGPLEVVVVQVEVLVVGKETDVAQGIYTITVEVEQLGGGHVVAQSQTVEAVPPGQLHGCVSVLRRIQSSCMQGPVMVA